MIFVSELFSISFDKSTCFRTHLISQRVFDII